MAAIATGRDGNDRPLVVGISGASCSGKTSVVERLCELRQHTLAIHQDKYYLDDSDIPTMDDGTPQWDVPEALDARRLVEDVTAALTAPQRHCAACGRQSSLPPAQHLVLVEGTMIFSISELKPLFHLSFFITLDPETSKTRRNGRVWVWSAEETIVVDPPGYFDGHVWPEYCKQRDALMTDSSIKFVKGNQSLEALTKIVSESIQTLTTSTII